MYSGIGGRFATVYFARPRLAKLDLLNLRVMNLEAQTRFYCDVLGMRELGSARIGYSDRQAAIRFLPANEPYSPTHKDLYWKIALSVPNIELAYEQMRRAGVQCSVPHQFEDVGYPAHFKDPEGFSIELIDHVFKNHRRAKKVDPNLLGGGAHLSLVTLRTADIEAVEPVLLDRGMRKLSVQPLHSYGFTLHFYAFTDEHPPDGELAAVSNRTWVYQRPYTVLEIQHVHDLAEESDQPQDAAGFEGLEIASPLPFPNLSRLKINWAV